MFVMTLTFAMDAIMQRNILTGIKNVICFPSCGRKTIFSG